MFGLFESKDSRRQRGYQWAKEALRTGEETFGSILAKTNNPFDRDEFDEGAEQAVKEVRE